MPGPVGRGLLAGAAGTAALNAAGHLDMALRGRSPGDVPERTVHAAAHTLGRRIPGRGAEQQSRARALGALGGAGVGLAVGAVAGVLRAAGLRLPLVPAAVSAAAGSAVAANAGPTRLGVTDPAAWSPAEWAADVVPHLAYGLTTAAALRALEPAEEAAPLRPATAGLALRSAALGLAAGSRSSLGLATALHASPAGLVAGRAAAALVTGELVADKLPFTPSRLQTPSLAIRVTSGVAGGAVLAHREHARPLVPGLVGGMSAALGSVLGAGWRDVAAAGLADWQAALLEDAVALGLVAFAARR